MGGPVSRPWAGAGPAVLSLSSVYNALGRPFLGTWSGGSHFVSGTVR